MKYAEWPPAGALAGFVECLWLARDDAAAAADPPEAVAPDGCLEWIFHRGCPYRRFEPDGTARVQPASAFVGLTTGPLRLSPTGPVETLGVRFRPGGAHTLLGLSLDELTESAVATTVLWGRAGRRLEEEVANARDSDAARGVVERFLLRRLAGRLPDPRLDAAVDRLLRRRGRASVAELARHAGWSTRQLEREFRRQVGVSPKTLSRIARFQNLLRLSGRDPAKPWAELAAASGYADQAHMTRDFRELSGGTPTQRHLAEGELTRHFVDPDRLDALLRSRSRVPSGVAFVQDAGQRVL